MVQKKFFFMLTRDKNVLTKKPTLENIFSLKHFPTYVGCVSTPKTDDKFLDLSVDICRETGILQLKYLASLDQVYLLPHNDAIGPTWATHNQKFIEFLENFSPSSIFEIGGGSGKLATEYVKRHSNVNWTILDPNPLFEQNDQIKSKKEYFSSDLQISEKFDAIIHAHVLEHQSYPEEFFLNISKYLKPNGLHIFSFPNLHEWLSRKYLNCINFEHTIFLDECYVDVALKRTGFELIKKIKFRDDHSIFYATKFSNIKSIETYPNFYHQNKDLFLNYVDYFKIFVSKLNSQLENFSGKVYLFGAHIFSQYLLAFGLNQSNIVGILDNSELKIGKRLYGTDLQVYHPKIIENDNVGVILKVGSYRNEILEQLTQINPNIIIFE